MHTRSCKYYSFDALNPEQTSPPKSICKVRIRQLYPGVSGISMCQTWIYDYRYVFIETDKESRLKMLVGVFDSYQVRFIMALVQ